jgi:large subunit ribosomal protein L15
MAELHDLSPGKGSHRDRKRVGRGPGSGLGKTAGRGQKGQKSRSGGSVPAGFEGGQMPLHRRIPKRGFRPRNRVEFQVVNLFQLEGFEGDVTPESLVAAGLVRSTRRPVKILGEGEIATALNVTAHAFSASARSKIEAAGGTATVPAGDVVTEEAPVAEATESDEDTEADEQA